VDNTHIIKVTEWTVQPAEKNLGQKRKHWSDQNPLIKWLIPFGDHEYNLGPIYFMISDNLKNTIMKSLDCKF
jgi:hypothetical protein